MSPIKSPSRIIDDFLEHQYYQGHHERVAQCAKDICEEKLRGAKIQAIYSSRGKDKDSLREKLEKRNAILEERGCGYKNASEIRSNVRDLAGVRIALYFPNQMDVVAGCIEKIFDVINWTDHPKSAAKNEQNETEDVDTWRPKFAGYKAKHAWVQFKKEDVRNHKKLEGLQKDLRDHDVVEIQIVTVLLHAWAEVEHDIAYKSIFKDAMQEERTILECLNGLVLSSELLLEQLYRLWTARNESAKEHFEYKYQLVEFMSKRIGNSCLPETVDKSDLDMLRRFLKTIEKDTPEALGLVLDELGFQEDADPKVTRDLNPVLNEIIERYPGFQPRSHMRIPFCITAYMLSNISEVDEFVAQHNLTTESQEPAQSACSRCKILLSSVLWLQELLPRPGLHEAFGEAGLEKEGMKNLDWLLHGARRIDILSGREPDEMERTTLDCLWTWFAKQPKDSVFLFVFGLARMGVLKDLSPDDLDQLSPVSSVQSNSDDESNADDEVTDSERSGQSFFEGFPRPFQ
ncbi:hypothetical protein K432DRAFT_462305 [Lepidopterella palustris CBS 459.81]|uniref:RelA/SpoT domain-containing protein n=1 Tax=Lepidopterella palustris CBS 459.81 TaxID=1314670 RepID=A0A8E2E3N5_9PEZI|nr:hypothetical protein K432DRAFT_462305 [Lepidopterella palustris CBS 459.81]